jgi:non-specific serine/threonine protein kinase/serine/threonine-protein kinase
VNAERYRRARDLFVRAIELDAAARESFVASACGADADLRAELVSLLAAHDLDHGFDSVAQDPAATARESASPPPLPERIGRYRILGLLGEGGMGVAYLAEQDNPRRRVALKVLHAGVVAPGRIQRFEREAQILGRLHHPGIAQVFDAGKADLGGSPRPFLAMELVLGRPLCEHADENGLSQRARLALLVAICHAVQHAHEKGVIHRDLKPANILVDEHGVPKILDFGIARATDEELAPLTLLTRAGEVLGTLPYMSPEQLEGDPEKVDARADVFALGVIGYELLSGRLPIEVAGKSLPEIARSIRDDEPPLLGTLVRALRGDVETIFAKALEKDRERRYASARDLALDLEHCLAEQPIAARPPSTAYQLAKFTRRNRLLVGGVGALLVTLILGIVGTASQAARAGRERDSALAAKRDAELDAERARTAQHAARVETSRVHFVYRFLEKMLTAIDPADLGRDVKVTDVLDRAGTDIEPAFAQDPESEGTLRYTIGMAYHILGKRSEAEEHLRKSIVLLKSAPQSDGAALARAQFMLGRALLSQGDLAEAHALLAEAMAAMRARGGADDVDALAAERFLAETIAKEGRTGEALAMLDGLVATTERIAGVHDELYLNCLGQKGSILLLAGRKEEGIEVLTDALAKHGQATKKDVPAQMRIRNELGNAYNQLGQYARAQAVYEELLPLQRSLLGDDSRNTLTSMNNLAFALARQGRFAEAVALQVQVLESRKRVFGSESTIVLQTMLNLAGMTFEHGDTVACETWLTGITDLLSKMAGKESLATLEVRYSVAGIRRAQGRIDDARTIALELVQLARAMLPKGERFGAECEELAGVLCSESRRFDEAETLLTNAREGFETASGPKSPDQKRVLEHLVRLYDTWKKPELAADCRQRLRSLP